jgi:hypothetical protein
MILYNLEDNKQYYEVFQNFIAKHTQLNLNGLLLDLLSNLTIPRIPEKTLDECKLNYKMQSTENRMWTLALISMSWILNNLRNKTENGHCQNIEHIHGEKTPRLCHKGSQFHKELYNDCLISFKEIVQSVEQFPPKNITTNG